MAVEGQAVADGPSAFVINGACITGNIHIGHADVAAALGNGGDIARGQQSRGR